MERKTRKMRIAIIGDTSVGKTALLYALLHEQTIVNKANLLPTIQEYYSWTVNSPTRQAEYQIDLRDTAGDTKLEYVTMTWARNSDIFLMVFSLAEAATFQVLKTGWLNFARNCSPSARIIVIGNKIDLSNHEVGLMELYEFAEQEGFKCLRTSALTLEGLNDLVHIIGELCDEIIDDEDTPPPPPLPPPAPQDTKSCC